MLLIHIRSIVVGILIIGGMISFGILYVLFNVPFHNSEGVPQTGENVSTAERAREDVFAWLEKKEAASKTVPAVSQSSFFIPRSL